MSMRCLTVLLLVAVVQAVAVAVPPEQFNATVDFDVSIQSLYEGMQANPEAVLNSERSVILDGMVASVTVLDPSEENFQAFIELVAGEWQGLSSVELYRTFVRVSGPEYYNRIATRQNREPGGKLIERNGRILVAGNVLGYLPDQTSSALIPAVEGLHIRSLP